MPNLTAGPRTARFLLLLTVGLRPATASAQTSDDPGSVSPGYVHVQEGTLYMVCRGTAGPLPTVVFENGLGSALDTWSKVQPEVARSTRACAYDRLGAGRSDPVDSTDTRTPFEQATTLHELLTRAGIAGPYVLVGHSIAGLVLLAYPHLYPAEVAGMVFVDCSHPRQWVRFQEAGVNAAPPIGISGKERVDRGAALTELGDIGNFGALPIAVVYRSEPDNWPQWSIWEELQKDHAARSTNSVMFQATKSGHYVQVDEPETVLKGIHWVLDEVAAGH